MTTPPFSARERSSSIFLTQACAATKQARILRSSMVSRWSSDTSTKGSGKFVPALLTTMSRFGNAAIASRNALSLVTSHSTTRERPPPAPIFADKPSRCERVRPSRITSAPTCAKPSAIAAPNPRPAPVTNATLSSSRKLGSFNSSDTLLITFPEVASLRTTA